VARPRKEDRSRVRSTVFTMKLSEVDRALLARLVKARARDLATLTGVDAGVSIASYLRWLWERDAAARRRGPKTRQAGR
jgi:hypothetical protein